VTDEHGNREATDGSDNLYRGNGAGSLEYEDGRAPVDSGPNDGRYDTRTTFYYSYNDQKSAEEYRDRHQLHRDPDDRRSWEMLAEWNDGVGDPGRSRQNYEADVGRWIDTFAGQLGLSDYHRERVEYIINEIELSHGKITAEQMILGAISLVFDADIEDPDAIDDRIIYRDTFNELLDSVDMDRADLWTVRRVVHQKTTVFD
jgi:hypothetical protein